MNWHDELYYLSVFGFGAFAGLCSYLYSPSHLTCSVRTARNLFVAIAAPGLIAISVEVYLGWRGLIHDVYSDDFSPWQGRAVGIVIGWVQLSVWDKAAHIWKHIPTNRLLRLIVDLITDGDGKPKR